MLNAQLRCDIVDDTNFSGDKKGPVVMTLFLERVKKKKKTVRFYRDLNSDRWIQSPEC